MKFSRVFVLSLASLFLTNVSSFTHSSSIGTSRPLSVQFSSSSSSSSETTSATAQDPLGLTTELRRLTDAFANIGDDKLRYKQLLYMASNGLEPMPEELKIPENKVLGCLSTVHVHATCSNSDKGIIQFTGDSDGLLTKGLVALLVRGLSGNTAEDIQKVDPAFIKTAGIAQSLTPGRNNGFLNMLAMMKKKALEATSQQTTTTATTATTTTTAAASSDRPVYSAIVSSLQALKPTVLELKDNSHEHAGHAGNKGNGQESHFQLSIVADAFDGLNLVKRHKLIYMLLGDVMPKIHALQIQALTPQEAESK